MTSIFNQLSHLDAKFKKTTVKKLSKRQKSLILTATVIDTQYGQSVDFRFAAYTAKGKFVSFMHNCYPLLSSVDIATGTVLNVDAIRVVYLKEIHTKQKITRIDIVK